MGVRYPGRATIDPSNPRAVGVCDRCGFLYDLHTLRYQPNYAGPKLLTTRLRVCERCWDEPNPQMRTIRIPPDPWPVADPRVENFAVDEKNFLELKAYVGKPSMFRAIGGMGCALTHVGQLPPALLTGVGTMDTELYRGVNIPSLLTGVGAMDAELTLVSPFMPLFDGVGAINAELYRGVNIPSLFTGVGVMDTDLTLFGPVREIDLFASNTTSDSLTISAPASIVAGDLIIAVQRSRNISGIPTAAIPSGFTSIQDVSLTDCRQILSYKVAAGSEGGATLSGMSSDVGASGSCWVVLVFRAIYAATTANVVDVDGQMTNAAPTNQTITSSGGVAPLVVFGVFGSSAIGTTSFTPSADATFNATALIGGAIRLEYKIYDSSPADVTVTKNDSGDRNTLQSCYIELSN